MIKWIENKEGLGKISIFNAIFSWLIQAIYDLVLSCKRNTDLQLNNDGCFLQFLINTFN